MSKNPVMSYPIQKRIITKLFIDKTEVLYIQKWGAKLSGKFEEGKSWHQDYQ